MPFILPFGGPLMMVAWVVALGFKIWMLVDVLQRSETDFSPPTSRTWWIVGLAIGIFVGWLGLAIAIAYFVLVRKPATEGKPAPQLFGGTGGGARDPGLGTGRACRNCGEPLGTHARYCQRCGTPAEDL